MVKYLTQKDLTFGYRRRLKGRGEIVLSLGTKNFSSQNTLDKIFHFLEIKRIKLKYLN